jgi:hypothetical protein
LSGIYSRGEALGWGSIAAVYEGWDDLLERRVALKELIPPFAGSEPFVRAFLGRALTIADVRHAHLLAIYSIDTGHKPPLLVREVADLTLWHTLVAGPVEHDKALDLLRQALAGLAALHDRGLVHGAVKPENLFLFDDRLKVGDFGVFPGAGSPAPPAQHWHYAPPELQWESEEPVGPAADIYSLGLVFYQLLLGVQRFDTLLADIARRSPLPVGRAENRASGPDDDGKDPWQLFRILAKELPPPHELLPELPMSFSLTLASMVRKDPAQRLTGVKEVLASLGESLPGAAASPSGSAHAPAAPRGLSRLEPPAWIAAGAVAALLIAGAGWWLATQTRAGLHDQRASDLSRAGDPSLAAAPGGEAATSAPDGASSAAALENRGAAGTGAPQTGLPRRSSTETEEWRAAPAPQQRPGPGTPPRASLTTATASGEVLASRLLSLVEGAGLAIEVEPPGAGSIPRFPLGTPMRLRITSQRPGFLVVFALSADGSISCLYPNSAHPTLAFPEVVGGGALELPLDADRRAGFELAAAPPLGRDLVFVLRSSQTLPSPPSSGTKSSWLSEYPFRPAASLNPARSFAEWVAELRRVRPRETAVAVREIEVTAAP